MTTTKYDIAQQMSERLGIEPEDSLHTAETILSVLGDALTDGHYWEIRNFGVFKLKQRAPRMGRNIHTGEKIPVQPYRDVVFKPGKEMLERIAQAPKIVRPKPRKNTSAE